MTVHRLDETDSTNLEARAGAPGDVFVAEFQRAGRGRLGHSWHAARGENLTFSAVLGCDGRPPSEVATLPLVVGLAVAKGLQSPYGRARFAVKWPNDVMAGGRKVAGILCELHGDSVIAGIGLNVNQTRFPPEIADRATSLAVLEGRSLDRDKVLAEVLSSLEARHAEWLRGGFAALHGELAELDCLRGAYVSVRQTDGDLEPVSGICGGIAEDGTLLVGGRRVFAGEAHVDKMLTSR